VLLRAPFHDGRLREYTDASGDLTTWMSMLAASVGGAEAVITRYGADAGRSSIVTGMSLGGWVANLHRSYLNTATLYAPMLAGAHLGRQMVDSSYRWMVSRRALADADQLRMTLDFDGAFRAVPDDNVVALLARHDQFARLDHQAGDYGAARSTCSRPVTSAQRSTLRRCGGTSCRGCTGCGGRSSRAAARARQCIRRGQRLTTSATTA
jgi:hypothetical protein